MKVFESIANALSESGVTDVFGLMGDGNMKLLSYWSNELGLAYYGSRHESAAIAMADGYSRATGKVGICSVTQGPGVTNSITALITARKAGSKVIIFSGDTAAAQKGWPQDINQEAIYSAAGIPVINIENPDSSFSDVLRALQMTHTIGGPVAVNMPLDVQEMEWGAWNDETELPIEEQSVTSVASLIDIQKAFELLKNAKQPVIVAGRGVIESNCEEELLQIASATGALLSTTLRGNGLFSDDPFLLGIAGGLGTNFCAKLVGEADVALIVGAGMNDFTTMHQTLVAPNASIIYCDISPRNLDHNPSNFLKLIGDAKVTVGKLLGLITESKIERIGYRRPELIEELTSVTPESEFTEVFDAPNLDPRQLTIRLNDVLPDNRLVVTDAGHFFGNPCTYMHSPDARSFICGIDFGSIGLGIGHAIGVSVSNRDRPTILFVGDGGMQMSLGDIETAVRYKLPLIIVVMNDAAYGSELQIMDLWGLPTELTVFPRMDFSAVAVAMGARTISISNYDDLDALREVSFDEGPILLDCPISRKMRAAWLDEAFTRH